MTPVIDILNRDLKEAGADLYVLGNCLRGYVHGYFHDDYNAFRVMAARFDKSYPSTGGRTVEFWRCLSTPYSGYEKTLGDTANAS